MRIWVETRENALGDREPCRFRVGLRSVDVVAVLDRWLHPEHGYFKVQVADGAVYILHQDAKAGQWEIALYESGQQPRQQALPEVKSRQ